MTFPLTVTDGSCTVHKDCTTTTYANSLGVIGVRHLHQWLDPQGIDLPDRGPDDLVFGAWNVGLLLSYDETTGEHVFDPAGSVLTASAASDTIVPADRLLDVAYCLADDHRVSPDAEGRRPKIVGAGRTRSGVTSALEAGQER